MKKIFIGLILVLACLPALAANPTAYVFSIVDAASRAITDANFTVTVYDYGTTDAATIYSDDGVTTYTNPMIGDAYPASGKGTVIFWGNAVHYTIKITSSVYTSAAVQYADFGTTDHIIVFPLAEAVGNIQAGTMTASGAVTLNGNVTLGDSISDTITITGKLATATPIAASTITTGTVTAAMCYGSTIVFETENTLIPDMNLPAAVAGMEVTFIVGEVADCNINPQTGDYIRLLTNAAGDAISSASAIGNMVTLYAIDDVNWIDISHIGTWTDIN